jgi:hypothetical protein
MWQRDLSIEGEDLVDVDTLAAILDQTELHHLRAVVGERHLDVDHDVRRPIAVMNTQAHGEGRVPRAVETALVGIVLGVVRDCHAEPPAIVESSVEFLDHRILRHQVLGRAEGAEVHEARMRHVELVLHYA